MSPISTSGKVTLKQQTHPAIVTDSLVLNLDAGNTSSYPGTGTTWTDLSGNGNNGTLINGPTYNSSDLGSIVFDGTNDRVDVGESSDYAFGTGDFTVECWAWRDGSQTDNASLAVTHDGAFGGADNQTWQFAVGKSSLGTSNKLVFYIGGSSNFSIADSATFPNQTWTHVAVTRSGTTVTLYKNTSSVASGTSSQNLSYDDLDIGLNRNGVAFWKGRISNVKLYKGKALTASEIQQNYNALKWRYGL